MPLGDGSVEISERFIDSSPPMVAVALIRCQSTRHDNCLNSEAVCRRCSREEANSLETRVHVSTQKGKEPRVVVQVYDLALEQ